MKALFVCTGNSCRSVMGEFLFEKAARDRGLAGWEAKSAGVAAEHYFSVPGGVHKALGARGISPVVHQPQLVTRDLLRWADEVYAMARNHRDLLWDQYPEFQKKTFLFLDKAGLGEKDVDDPIGQSDQVYEQCRDIIEDGIGRLLENHAKPTADPRP